MSELKLWSTHSFDDEKLDWVESKKFEDVTDADLYATGFFIKRNPFCEDGTITKDSWLYLSEFISCKKAFSPTFVYLAIKDCCKWENNKLVLKPHRNVYVEMY